MPWIQLYRYRVEREGAWAYFGMRGKLMQVHDRAADSIIHQPPLTQHHIHTLSTPSTVLSHLNQLEKPQVRLR